MKISARKYAISLYQAIQDLKPDQLDQVIKNFVELLGQYNALSLGPKIIEEFENYWWQQKNTVKVELVTAKSLSQDQERSIIEQLKHQFKKEVVASTSVDKSLVGGVVIKFDNNLIDGSIKSQLLNLKNNLIK